MKEFKNSLKIILIAGFLLVSSNTFSQDPNFHIYLCFGQSNMQGQGTIEAQDRVVNSRMKVMQAVNCSNLGRTKGNWYTAIPPLTRCWSGLSPADYFGRTMVDNLPADIKVGIINVSVAGCKIELFDKATYQTYVNSVTETWLKNIINEYGGNPYEYLVEIAKLAQKDGVIKGFLLHQGESNTGDNQWPSKVKNIYNNLITDLGLEASKIPLLAGELVHADQGGLSASMNSIIAKLPQSIPNSYVISSSKCTDTSDNIHFDSAGYRELGRRYAIKMLSIMGIDVEDPVDLPITIKYKSNFYEAECGTVGKNWDILANVDASNGSYVMAKPGFQNISFASTHPDALIDIPFVADSTENLNLYIRVNCSTADDDSFWIKLDNGPFTAFNGLTTSGWAWIKLTEVYLTKGQHKLTICYREDGAKLDKICFTNSPNPPTGNGDAAKNICNPKITTSLNSVSKIGFSLEQNYPNPVHKNTIISFEIPENSFVSLKIYNLLGVEIDELAGNNYNSGKHIIDFNTESFTNGIYIYSLITDSYSESKKMTIYRK